MDDVKVDLDHKGMTVKVVQQCTKDRKEWRALVHIKMIYYDAAIVVYTFGRDSGSLVAYHLESGWDAVT